MNSGKTDIVCDIGDTILIPAKVSRITVFTNKKVEYRVELPSFLEQTRNPYDMNISQDQMAKNAIKVVIGENQEA